MIRRVSRVIESHEARRSELGKHQGPDAERPGSLGLEQGRKTSWQRGGRRMNIYLAGASYNKALLNVLKDYLSYRDETGDQEYRLCFVSDWLLMGSAEENADRFKIDIENGVDKADLVLATYPYGPEGTLCEMAYAVGKGIPVIYLRLPEFADEDPLIIGGRSVELESVANCTTLENFEEDEEGLHREVEATVHRQIQAEAHRLDIFLDDIKVIIVPDVGTARAVLQWVWHYRVKGRKG